ncbi:MAG TPA: YdcF family protein [Gemmatimonadales bacterium]|nr:YdcF family protein [Gemmatimonadales bacterium]
MAPASSSEAVPGRRGGAKLGWRLLAVVGVVVGMVYTVAFVLVLIVSQLDERRAADAIVVLGAAQYNGWPSPVLRARLDHGLALYREGLAPTIVVTGGVGRGDKESEAMVARRYLLAHHVPDSAVVVQPQGRSTQASMTAVAGWLAGRGRRTAILVSDPFHMFRLRLEARRTGLAAYTSPTETSPISDNPVLELEYLAAEAVKVPVAWVRSLDWFH